MKLYTLFLFLFLLVCPLSAQQFFRLDLPVEIDGKELGSPWAGGLNSPQFSMADLNNDGIPDLYVFDRSSNFHSTFLNEGTLEAPNYVFAPLYVKHFPTVFNFAILRDYNQDGIMDLFANADDEIISGYKVYKGYYQNNELQFERVKFDDFEYDVLNYADSATGKNEFIFTNKVNFPSIEDMDGDGDLDILTNLGDSHLTFFQNMAIERGLTTESLVYELVDECWGKLYIDASGESLTLSDGMNNCAIGGLVSNETATDRQRHGGSTVTTFDIDNDGDKEVFYGDATNPRVILGKNGGTLSTAWITEQDTKFPSYDTPIFIPDFATTFFLDVDNDGHTDLIGAPNLGINGPDYESAWYYRNTATNEAPEYELQQKNFLIDEMIDLGTGAHPTFVDYNADGLLDLVVGNDNRWQQSLQFSPSLYLFENVGTSNEPRFKLVDKDWLNFNQFRTVAYGFAPTFGDLDNDGDLDLLVGERFGTLFYAENTAGANQPFAFGMIQAEWKDIDVGQFSTPHLADLNQDGKLDLLVGERNGNVNYLPNQGTSTNPDFHPNANETPNNNFFGQIATTETGDVVGSSSPFIVHFEDLTYLATGSESGYQKLYLVDETKLNEGAFELTRDEWGKTSAGKTSHTALADLNNDNFLDIVIGNSRGGLELFTTNLNSVGVLPTKETELGIEVKLFPNPTRNNLQISIEGKPLKQVPYRILNTVGQVVGNGYLNQNITNIEVNYLNNGLYFLEMQIENHVLNRRFIKQH